MSSQTQDIDATSPDNGIILCADTAAGSCPRGTTRLFSRRAAQEDAGVSVQAHEDLVSEVMRLCESLARIQNALDQSEAERIQLFPLSSTACSLAFID